MAAMNHVMIEKIERANHIVLMAHVNPDADSLGSASAFYSYLLRQQKQLTLFCATPRIDRRLALLPWFDKLRHQMPRQADLAICFDCGSRERLGTDIECELINIDHHASNSGFGMYNVIDTNAISTTQMVYDFFREHHIAINAKMATALYAGLVDDSQHFLHTKTDAAAFEMAAELLRCGADTRGVAKALFQTTSLASLRLEGVLYEQLRLRHDGRIALLHLDLQTRSDTGAEPHEAEAALHRAQTLATVNVSVLLRERRHGSVKCSLRGDGSVNVAAVAAHFGGGGHRDSAGFIANGTLCALEEEIMSILYEEMS
ncbi:MAG: hypothetical protein DSZ03_03800 [Sulfurimonas sp.]|nr:MAG: hypothetical protein DSZ03_03800 [Sulfurimonas sp.]